MTLNCKDKWKDQRRGIPFSKKEKHEECRQISWQPTFPRGTIPSRISAKIIENEFDFSLNYAICFKADLRMILSCNIAVTTKATYSPNIPKN